MKSTIIKSIFLFLLFFLNFSFAQFEITKPSWYPSNTFNTLYVQVGDLDAPYTKKIIEIINENWKVCPVKYYLKNNFDTSLLVDGNLFLNVEKYSIESQNVRNSQTAGTTYGAVVYNDYYYLHFWVIDKKYNPKKDWWDFKFTVARAELYLMTIGMGEEELKTFQITLSNQDMRNIPRKERFSSNFDFTDADFKTYYCNGMAGNIKNMIQYVNRQILANKEEKILEDTKPTVAIAKLKTETLYFPNYWYGPGGTMLEKLPANDKMYKLNVKYIEDLIKAYPYKIKMITRPELDEMILNATTDFYYVNYIQSSADKIMSVVNGLTGEVIYSEITKLSYRPKDKDFERIGKAAK